jgi:hypothetical protein
MYMMSWNEEDSRIEASLGGRISAPELRVLSEELKDLITELDEKPYLLLLDYSKTQPLDDETKNELFALKDLCLDGGVEKIVSVARDDEEAASHIDQRLQYVLEGREAIVAMGDELPHISAPAEVYEIQAFRRAA